MLKTLAEFADSQATFESFEEKICHLHPQECILAAFNFSVKSDKATYLFIAKKLRGSQITLISLPEDKRMPEIEEPIKDL